MHKVMKTRQYILSFAAALALFMPLASCSDDEDTTPSNADVNGFAVADDDQSETAQIRRDFFSATGSYLLFTDTLGLSSNGTYELLDPGYAIFGSSSSNNYQYGYITDVEEQAKAAQCVETYLMSKLGKSAPYSVFLVNDLYYYNDYGRKRTLTMYLGARTYVLSMSDGEAYDDPSSYFSDMLKDIITDVLDKHETEMEAFYAYSDDYYGDDLADHDLDSLTEQETWDLGFFRYEEDEWWGSYFLYKSSDLSDWLDAELTYTPETFEEKYGSSSVMVNKFNTLREILLSLGFVLE